MRMPSLVVVPLDGSWPFLITASTMQELEERVKEQIGDECYVIDPQTLCVIELDESDTELVEFEMRTQEEQQILDEEAAKEASAAENAGM